MAEKANPKSQPGKGQPSPRRRAQVAAPRAGPAQEVTRATRDPGPGHRPPPRPAAPPAPATGRSPRVPSAQDTAGTSTAGPGDNAEPAPRRVRVARLTEAGLRQLGDISSHQRIREWLDSTSASRAQDTAQLQEELEEELDEYWESEEHRG